MSSNIQPEQHHSVDVDNLFHHQPPSLESGLIFEIIEDTKQLQTHLIHPNRITNSTETKREPKAKLNFPPANSP